MKAGRPAGSLGNQAVGGSGSVEIRKIFFGDKADRLPGGFDLESEPLGEYNQLVKRLLLK